MNRENPIQAQIPTKIVPSMQHVITTAVERLQDATVKYAEAKDEASEARTKEINALDNLNKAQRELDSLMEHLRKDADYNTDWASSSRPTIQAVGGG